MNTNTEQKTVYILQKDLPYVKAGTRYIKGDGFNGVSDRCSYVPDKMGMMYDRFAIHVDYVENNPEWFLPEQPKEWEIVARIDENAMTDIPNANIVKKGDIGWVYAELRNYPIHSVRRLSDGETFSVGENATYGRINGFEIREGEMGVLFHKLDPLQSLYQISKLPPPTPKEETIKVVAVVKNVIDGYLLGDKIVIYSDGKIPESKHELIKKAVNEVLNDNPQKFILDLTGCPSDPKKFIQFLKTKIVKSQSFEYAAVIRDIERTMDAVYSLKHALNMLS